MKRIIAGLLTVLCISFVFTACYTATQSNWGSFSSERTESYDQKYYAEQKVVKGNVVVTVYNSETDSEVFSFTPARASDFWGICWESNSYNIWIQSGDIGVLCYQYDQEIWTLNERAAKPDNIVSKYDINELE